MIKNYFKTAFRNISRSKTNSIINTLGLSFGITGSLVLFLLVQFLLSFDSYHEKKDRVYRVVTDTYADGVDDHTPGVPPPLPTAMKTDFGEYIEDLVFISYKVYGLVGFMDAQGDWQSLQEDTGITYSQPSFFKIFDRMILKGNADKLLDGPNKVVLSEKLAIKYFQDRDPVGQLITLDKGPELEVTGIMEDFPGNTDFPFEMIISFSTIEEEYLENNGWGSISSDDQCYLLLKEGVSPATIESGFPRFVKKYLEDDFHSNRSHQLQSLATLHFDTDYSNYSYNITPMSDIWAMVIIGIFLILTACINFVNLSTAASVKRAKEVGIRKVLGGSQSQLIWQFLGESFIVVLTAVFIALGLAELALGYVNSFLDLQLRMDILTNKTLMLYLVIVPFLIALLSGLYPAFVQARFKPATALKSRLAGHPVKGYSLRKALVVFQFLVSQVFIISTVVILDQVDYFKSKDLGFQKEGILTTWIPVNDNEKRKTLKTKVQSLAGVDKVSLNYTPPSSGSVSETWVQIDTKPNGQETQYKLVDENYFDVFELELLVGEGLMDSDTVNRVVVNEAFCKAAGVSPDSIIGKIVRFSRRNVPVTGVVKDFHTESFHDKIGPTLLANGIHRYQQIAIKLAPGGTRDVPGQVEDIWKDMFPEYTYDASFMEEDIDSFYESERRMSTIFSVFSGIAIFIGCLGLFGLASFMANQKVKEIGVRKVLGASIHQILYLFSKEFTRLILVAFVLAVPLAWLGMDRWLQGFEYRITLGAPVFLFGAAITLVIALFTVGLKTVRAAMANPVDSLRDE